MSTTTVPTSGTVARVRRAGSTIKSVLDEMTAARAVGRGGPRR